MYPKPFFPFPTRTDLFPFPDPLALPQRPNILSPRDALLEQVLPRLDGNGLT